MSTLGRRVLTPGLLASRRQLLPVAPRCQVLHFRSYSQHRTYSQGFWQWLRAKGVVRPLLISSTSLALVSTGEFVYKHSIIPPSSSPFQHTHAHRYKVLICTYIKLYYSPPHSLQEILLHECWPALSACSFCLRTGRAEPSHATR